MERSTIIKFAKPSISIRAIFHGYVKLPEGNMVIQWRENGNVMDKKSRYLWYVWVCLIFLCPTIVNLNGENDDNHDDFFLGK